MKMLVSNSAKVDINVRGGYLYLEISKKIAEKVGEDGKTIPIFYDKESGKKDSRIAKFNYEEVVLMAEAMKIFATRGIEGYEKFSQRMNGDAKYKNIMFIHNDRMVGLRASKTKEGREIISFVIQEGKGNNIITYSCGTSSPSTALYLANVLETVAGEIYKQKMEVTNSYRQKKEVTNNEITETEEEVFTEYYHGHGKEEQIVFEVEETYDYFDSNHSNQPKVKENSNQPKAKENYREEETYDYFDTNYSNQPKAKENYREEETPSEIKKPKKSFGPRL